jgi:hypothetical protein
LITNEEFMMQLCKCNGGEMMEIEETEVTEDGTKTYKVVSYGSQEWIHFYYIKFDKYGNFINIEFREEESFC